MSSEASIPTIVAYIVYLLYQSPVRFTQQQQKQPQQLYLRQHIDRAATHITLQNPDKYNTYKHNNQTDSFGVRGGIATQHLYVYNIDYQSPTVQFAKMK